MKVGPSCVYPSPPGKPIPEPPDSSGGCPVDFHRQGDWCVRDPVDPGAGGGCPVGFTLVNGKCTWDGGVPPTPPGPGGGTGGGTGGGNGNGDGDGESAFAGSCSSGFACEGDAIQCAIAKEQHIRNCKLFEDKSPESQLYETEKAKGRDRDVTKDLPGNETIDVSSKLSRENLLGAGACIRDLSVRVWSQELSLPISAICPALGYLGYVLITVASLAAFRIVSGSNKGD